MSSLTDYLFFCLRYTIFHPSIPGSHNRRISGSQCPIIQLLHHPIMIKSHFLRKWNRSFGGSDVGGQPGFPLIFALLATRNVIALAQTGSETVEEKRRLCVTVGGKVDGRVLALRSATACGSRHRMQSMRYKYLYLLKYPLLCVHARFRSPRPRTKMPPFGNCGMCLYICSIFKSFLEQKHF
jgi:hypothetical protein